MTISVDIRFSDGLSIKLQADGLSVKPNEIKEFVAAIRDMDGKEASDALRSLANKADTQAGASTALAEDLVDLTKGKKT